MGFAVIFGGIAVFAFGENSTEVVSWSLPDLAFSGLSYTFASFVAISLPMVIFAMGLGNVQGLGFLMSQDYRVPIKAVTVTTGVNSILNALLGGHGSSVARSGTAILAGPKEGRYWAAVIAGFLSISLALGAGTLTSLLAVLPRTFVVTLAGGRHSFGPAKRIRDDIRRKIAVRRVVRAGRRGDSFRGVRHYVRVVGDSRRDRGVVDGRTKRPVRLLARRENDLAAFPLFSLGRAFPENQGNGKYHEGDKDISHLNPFKTRNWGRVYGPGLHESIRAGPPDTSRRLRAIRAGDRFRAVFQ